MRSRPRFTCLVILGVYPLVTLISYMIAPFTVGWAIWQRTALLSPLMAVAMIYGLIPMIQTHFARFIAAEPR
jgi:antibiotic biosynthesis monooxygenase (ABM) superfamily enzyme